MSKSVLIKTLLAGSALLALNAMLSAALAEKATVVELTQTGCQFVESENDFDHGFTAARKADCEAVNDTTGAERLAKSRVLTLKPGKYVFRVTNKNVPNDLGFWLRGKGLGRLTLPSVSGGGLGTGVSKDYAIDLKEGEYFYSCPSIRRPTTSWWSRAEPNGDGNPARTRPGADKERDHD